MYGDWAYSHGGVSEAYLNGKKYTVYYIWYNIPLKNAEVQKFHIVSLIKAMFELILMLLEIILDFFKNQVYLGNYFKIYFYFLRLIFKILFNIFDNYLNLARLGVEIWQILGLAVPILNRDLNSGVQTVPSRVKASPLLVLPCDFSVKILDTEICLYQGIFIASSRL